MNEKYFNQWHKVKKQINKIETAPTFREREIWWCSVGQNIGFEIYGKNDAFVRPVLVVKKFGKYTFLGVPLTSNSKENYFRYPFHMNGKKGSLILDQTRTYDSRRFVGKKLTIIHPKEFDKIKQAMKACFDF